MHAKGHQAIIVAAKAGGKVSRSYFGKVLTITEKSKASDVRTEADVESETVIVGILKKAFPTYNIFSEECGMIDKNSEYTFYIYPLDGTNNFALGVPNFSVSIALCRGREAVAGVIHLPMLGLTYSAREGAGAFCNDIPVKLSPETSLERSTSAFMCGYHCPKPIIIETIGRLSVKTKRVLVNWSVASDMCLLVAGKIETIVACEGMELHDFLAGKLIAKEAGCVITDHVGRPEKDDFNAEFVASCNQELHEKVTPLLF